MGRVFFERGSGREKWWAQFFSLQSHQNLISPKWGENGREKEEDVCWTFFFCLDKISSCLYSTFTLVWFLIFNFFYVDKNLHNTLWFFLFVFICFLFYFYPFSICLFYKKNLIKVSIQFKKKKKINVLLFVYIFSKDIMENLYQLFFHPLIFYLNQTKKFSILTLFHLFNQTQMREN